MSILQNILDTLKILPKGTYCLPLKNNKTPLGKFKDFEPASIQRKINAKTKAYGVRCFKVVCVDCDLDKEGSDIFEEFREGTFKQQTGGGGLHYIYLIDDRMKHWSSQTNITESLFDIKIGPNAYFVGNGSKSKKGFYKLLLNMPPQQMPQKLFDYINEKMPIKKMKPKKVSKVIAPNEVIETKKNEFVELKKLLNLLPDKYFSDYSLWRNIGWIIHYETNGEGLNLFVEYSRKVKEYENKPLSEFKEFWAEANKENERQLTIATLYKYLKDEKIEFYSWCQITNADVAKRIYKEIGHKFACRKSDKKVKNDHIIYFNGDIWTSGAYSHFVHYLSETLRKKLTGFVNRMEGQEDTKQHFREQLVALSSSNFHKSTYDYFMTILKRKNEIEEPLNFTEPSRDFIQFKNGCFNLKTCEFRKRTPEDYISLTLDYNYRPFDPNIDDAIRKDIIRIFRQIQTKMEHFEALFSWMGYCLTGQTREQLFYYWLGETACNGKTTIQEILSKCFPLYVKSISKDTFASATSESSRNKSFAQLVKNPLRMIFLNDIEGKQDRGLIKDFVDGKAFEIKLLYREGENYPIHCKLTFTGNSAFECKTDKGLFRRGRQMAFNSQFVKPEKIAEVEAKHPSIKCFPIDKKLLERFDDDDYKINMFFLIHQFTLKWLNGESLFDTDEYHSNFTDDLADGDIFSSVIEDTFHHSQYDECLSKNEILEIIGQHPNIVRPKWNEVRSKLKAMGFVYNSKKKRNGCKGCFMNITSSAPNLQGGYENNL